MGECAALTGPRDQGPVFQIMSGAPASAGGVGAGCTMQRDRTWKARGQRGISGQDDGAWATRKQKPSGERRSMQMPRMRRSIFEVRGSRLEVRARCRVVGDAIIVSRRCGLRLYECASVRHRPWLLAPDHVCRALQRSFLVEIGCVFRGTGYGKLGFRG